MTREEFRRDRFLRSSGYNLFLWGGVNLAVTAPGWLAWLGRPWPKWAAGLFPLGCVVVGVLVSRLLDNRTEKMCGPAGETPRIDAAKLWGRTFLLGVGLSIALPVVAGERLVSAAWLVLVGLAYRRWGTAGDVPEMGWLGACLLVAAILSASTGILAGPGVADLGILAIWCVAAGFLFWPFGAWINERYLYFRPEGSP